MLASLKISHLEQLNSKIFALLLKLFPRFKIDHLLNTTGIKPELSRQILANPRRKLALVALKISQ
ncbi:hypothetical protein CKO50_20300 [Pseudoalteromonas sp. HM-SA03]|nr:hypothetical protein CKO50_20300 [Pseudoalteromonas sp. HM-SA03]